MGVVDFDQADRLSLKLKEVTEVEGEDGLRVDAPLPGDVVVAVEDVVATSFGPKK